MFLMTPSARAVDEEEDQHEEESEPTISSGIRYIWLSFKIRVSIGNNGNTVHSKHLLHDNKLLILIKINWN